MWRLAVGGGDEEGHKAEDESPSGMVRREGWVVYTRAGGAGGGVE